MMKKTIPSILDSCEPQELDTVLEKVNIDLPEEADADRIAALAMQKAGAKPRRNIRRLALISAAVILLACILVSCYVAETVEYDNAVKFFDLNELNAEGMSRADLKRVYKDITTESFQYDDSYQLLGSDRASRTVEGVDITIMNSGLNDLSNSDIEAIGFAGPGGKNRGDIPADADYGFENNIFMKDVGGVNQWKITLPFIEAFEGDYYVADGKVLIWTSSIYYESNTFVMLVDDPTGAVIWKNMLKSKKRYDDSSEAVLTDDGRVGVLSLGSARNPAADKVLAFCALDADGKLVSEYQQPADGIIFLDRLIPLSDGWLAEVQQEERNDADGKTNDEGMPLVTMLIKLDDKGAVVKKWSLSDYGDDTKNADIKEYQGKIFLSVQAHAQYDALSEKVDYENIPKNIDSLDDGFTDELRDAAREVFGSVLYVFDPESDAPEEFYSVGGTMPGDLHVDDDGNLVWSVGRIIKCGWAPWANSFQYYGVTRQYDYIFDRDKSLLRQERTDIFKRFQTM